MHFIHKKGLTRVQALSNKEVRILKNIDSPSGQEYLELLEKLISARKTNLWIECDCQQTKAILVICLTPKGGCYVRCKERATHKGSCFFYSKVAEFDRINKNTLLPKSKIKKFVLYYSPDKIHINKKGKDHNKKESAQTLNSLGKAFYTIFTDSNLITRTPRGERIKEQYEKIRLAVNDPQKVMYNRVPLSRYFQRYLSEKTLDSATKLLRYTSWERSFKPFMYFLTTSKEITEHSFYSNIMKKWVQVESQIILPSGRINYAQNGPYCLLSTVQFSEESNTLVFKDCFAMPVLSASELMPLESHFERKVLKIILRVTKNFNLDNSIHIEKPLFCIKAESNRYYRPDFIIHVNQFKIFIEVLGSRESEYIDHKTEMKSISLDECDDYISIHAYKMDDKMDDAIRNSFIAALNKSISKFI